MGGHKQAIGGHGCHTVVFGLVGTSAQPLTSLGVSNPRSQSPFVEETAKGCPMTEMGAPRINPGLS